MKKNIASIVTEHLNEAILVVDDNHIIKYINPSAATLLEINKKDVLGKDLFQYFSFDNDCANTLINDVIESGLDYFSETATLNTTVENKKISYTMTKFQEEDIDGYMIVARDITKESKNQEEIFKLSQIVNQSADTVTLTDYHGDILYANPMFFKTTGYSYDEVIGQNHRLVKSGKHDDRFYKKLWETIFSGKLFKGVITNKKKNGELYHELKTITPLIDDEGKILNYIATGKDISAQVQAENQLKSLNQELEKKVEEEVEKNRDKDKVLHEQSRRSAMGELLVNIAHQWRQPLNSIGLVIQDIEDRFEYEELTKETMKKASDDILGILSRLSGVINQFTSFYESDRPDKEFPIKSTVLKALGLLGENIESNKLGVELTGDLDIRCFGDENELTQVFLNIFTNGKDLIKDRNTNNPKIIVNLESQEDILIEITDNLGGAKDEILPRIFDPYFTTKFKGEGVGMGLYVVNEVITHKMKGTIEASNHEDGLKFLIKLPHPSQKLD
ncbi:MAG: PAS domain S-box protein [Campylobacterales bacterium]|nr:PAS domain S-box protein [Campylobacterales bacterium]